MRAVVAADEARSSRTPDQLAASAELSDAGLERRDVVRPIWAEMPSQVVERASLIAVSNWGEPGTLARRRDPRQCLAGGADATAPCACGLVGTTMAHSTMATVAASMAAMEVDAP
jgi:hypothetical protein